MSVVFQPWVGKCYKEVNRFGARILVLGESHYGTQEDLSPDFTIGVVEALARRERHPFFTKVSKVLLGLDSSQWISDEDRSEVWDHVAFYNFVQCFVSDQARVRPGQDMWRDSSDAFLQIIEMLKPDLVLVLGKELGENIPNLHSDIEICVIQHPSTGFSYEKWNPLFSDALKRIRS